MAQLCRKMCVVTLLWRSEESLLAARRQAA